jgi:hypothetical protein
MVVLPIALGVTTIPESVAIEGSAMENVQAPLEFEVGVVKLKLETLSFEIVTSVNVLGLFGSPVSVKVVSADPAFQFVSELNEPWIVTFPASTKLITLPVMVAMLGSDEVNCQEPLEFVVGGTIVVLSCDRVPVIGAKVPTIGVPFETVNRATRDVALKAPLAA